MLGAVLSPGIYRTWADVMPDSSPAILDAISVRRDGQAASAANIARKRSVFTEVLRYAVEPGALAANPLDRLSWKPPKVSETVDRPVVVNPRQAREVGTWAAHPRCLRLQTALPPTRSFEPI